MMLTPLKQFICIAIFGGVYLTLFGQEESSMEERLTLLSLHQLEERRDIVTLELAGLARYSMRSGVGSRGYRSIPYDHPDTEEWFQVTLQEETKIYEIVLVPTIRRDAQLGFVSDGFPVNFNIVAGKKGDEQGSIVASFTKEDRLLPRQAPLIIPCNGLTASWIRLEASLLSPRAHDGRYTLQMSEILIFSETTNVALRGNISTHSEQRAGPAGGWHEENLNNGFLPYLMDAAQGQQSLSYVSERDLGESPTLTLDLESSYRVDQIILHGVEQGDTVPQAYPGDFGFPRWLQIIGANQADFSDAEVLYDMRVRSSVDIAPIMALPLPPNSCRYVRLLIREPYFLEGLDANGSPFRIFRIGFSEIEIYSAGKNRSRGITPITNFNSEPIVRNITALTDGRNFYGNILPLKDWLYQLAKRHDLEIEAPLIEQELEHRYDQQTARLLFLSWVVAALIVGSIILYLITRFLRQKAIFDTRNRIAADLHDELGANLHAVSMLGELAEKAKEDPEKLTSLLERMRALVLRTNRAVKYCTNILDTPGLYEDFEDAMKRNADRLLADLDHQLFFEAGDTITKMRPSKRIGLFLFYKECLINIIRHSGSTHAETSLKTEGPNLHLQVSDNGHGFPESAKSKVPTSLRRRAKLLGGKVTVSNQETGGAQIHLMMKI